MGENTASFNGNILPVEATDIPPGNFIRINSFKDGKVWVVDDKTEINKHSKYKKAVNN